MATKLLLPGREAAITKAEMSAGKMQYEDKVTLEKGVPYPSRRHPRRFPFDMMEVGDSFLARVEDKAVIYYHMKMNGPKRFITRTVKEEELSWLRVWRVA